MGSTSQQLYSLSWGEFGSSLASAVQLLRGHGDLVDVTLAAEGRSFSAHKIVLSAASPFLLEILKSTPCQHPVVMLAGISANDLETILDFIYRGEISVDPSQLPSLLQAAHCLSIHGLQPPTIMTEKGEQIPASAIPGCNETIVSRDAVNSYLSQRRKKKKRKLSGGGGKWPKDYSSLEGRSFDSEDNRSIEYGRKNSDLSDEGEWNNKSRTLSDQPTTCPLCGAVIRQSRNLRRHLELLHFGAGSGSKTARVKKDQFERNFSKTPLSLLDNQKSDNSSYSTTMPSLNLSLSVNSGSSSIGVPGSLMISGTSALNSSDPGHHDHNLSLGNNSTHNNPVHSISYPPSSISAPSNANGLYSTESASMLSSLFPPIPTLTTLSSPHDMFRHSEFFRANMAYSQDPTRQQHFSNRQLQRMDAT